MQAITQLIETRVNHVDRSKAIKRSNFCIGFRKVTGLACVLVTTNSIQFVSICCQSMGYN